MQSFQPPRRILMGPGPSDVSPRVLQALARPTIGHLDPEFQTFMEDTKAALQRLFNAPDHACVPLPAPGDLSIVLDGAGRPRALVVTTGVDVVPFRDVDAAHVAAEGEGDVDRWRTEHEELFTAELAAAGLPFAPTVPVVLERFRLLDPKPPRHTRQPVTT